MSVAKIYILKNPYITSYATFNWEIRAGGYFAKTAISIINGKFYVKKICTWRTYYKLD